MAFVKKYRFLMFSGLALLAAYFINVEVQTYLGKQVLAEAGLESFGLEEALAKAANNNKLVLVDVSAIWCPTCRALDKKVFSDPQVQATLAQKYVFSRLEYESQQGQDFQKKYQVSGFPTLLVLDSGGRLVKKLRVTFEPGEFIGQLNI